MKSESRPFSITLFVSCRKISTVAVDDVGWYGQKYMPCYHYSYSVRLLGPTIRQNTE